MKANSGNRYQPVIFALIPVVLEVVDGFRIVDTPNRVKLFKYFNATSNAHNPLFDNY